MSSVSGGGFLTQRRLSREHMDDPLATRQDIEEALRFIRVVNRRIGGTAAAMSHFRRWAHDWPRQSTVKGAERSENTDPADPSTRARRDPRGGFISPIRILDIGAGSADIPLAIADWARQRGHCVHITAVDLHPVTLQVAQEFIGHRDDIELVQADALKLMDRFAPGSFDYVHAGMFLHHLDDVEVMTVLCIMDRLATRGIIWNDLIRGWIGRLGVRLATIRAPQKIRYDAIVSVDAGFTRREAIDLARRAGWTNPRLRRHLLHRFTLVGEKQA